VILVSASVSGKGKYPESEASNGKPKVKTEDQSEHDMKVLTNEVIRRTSKGMSATFFAK
jgi:hypothetical protein